MEKNEKILKTGLILISLSLIFSLAFSMLTKLKNPVFLQNYIEGPISLDEDYYFEPEFGLKYITNIKDDRKVTGISFEEEPDLIFNVNDYGFGGHVIPWFNNYKVDEIYGRYSIRTFYIKLDSDSIDKDFDEIELNNAKIFFDNGDIINANLGGIVIYKYEDNYAGEQVELEFKDGGLAWGKQENYTRKHLESLGSGSSSDGTGFSHFRAMKDITLVKLEFSLLNNIEDYIELKVDNIDYLDIEGIKISEGRIFNVDYNQHWAKSKIARYTTYFIEPKLIFKDDDGNFHSQRVNDIHSKRYDFNFIDTLKYLKARGEI